MAQNQRTLIGTVAALVIAGAAPGQAQAQAQAQDGETLFRQQCGACHRLDDRRSLGPPLRGVVGRKAGSVEGFRYSAAMGGSGLVWDEETLRRYLAAPRAVVPGTSMTYVGLTDAARVEAIIAVLKRLGE